MYAIERNMIAHMLVECGYYAAAKIVLTCSDVELLRMCSVYADLFDLEIPDGRQYLVDAGLICGDSLAG